MIIATYRSKILTIGFLPKMTPMVFSCFLLGIKNENTSIESDFKGALFENLIINEYMKQNFHHNLYHDFYYCVIQMDMK